MYSFSEASQVWDAIQSETVTSAELVCEHRFGDVAAVTGSLFWNEYDDLIGYVVVPAPGLEVKLARAGDKREVRYRGPSVTPGYWRAPEQTRAAFDDEGFFCSGDAARFIDNT